MKIRHADFALLVLRLGVGLSVVFANGYFKISGGPALWGKIGASMSILGITFWPVFWGFMAAVAEFFGGLLVAFGFLTRLGTFLGICTMIVALFTHYHKGDSFTVASHALEILIAYLAISITGAGKYSIDSKVKISGLLQ